MVNFGQFIIGIVLTGVFMFALIGFGIQMGLDNPTNQSIANNTLISKAYTDINDSLLKVKPALDKNKKGFFTDVDDESKLGIVLNSIIGIGSLLVNGFLQNVFQVISAFFSEVLGIDSNLVFGIMMSFFTITAILLAWRVYRAGT